MARHGLLGYGRQHTHNCIHNNHQQLTADQVVTKLVADMEKDADGIITGAEVLDEFVNRYDMDGDGSVMEHEFVQQWHAQYHDAHDFAGYLFHQLDANKDAHLTSADVPLVATKMDTSGDGKVSVAEFTTYMTQLYHSCTSPHGY